MIGNSGQFHDDDPQIINPLRSFYSQQFFAGQMPAHIVDGRRTIIQPVGERCDLVKRSAFCNFFKSTVNITDSLFCRNNSFTIQFQNILKHTMCSRVCRPQV